MMLWQSTSLKIDAMAAQIIADLTEELVQAMTPEEQG